MIRLQLITFVLLFASWSAAIPSLGEQPRTFTNPVIAGSFPDPTICRVGDDYYAAHSTFEYFPGVPIFHSRDLVNWKQIGHCLTRKSQLPLDKIRSSGGIYAPTLRYHDGIFYMVTTNVEAGGNFYVTATDPAGPWSEPIWLKESGIDPSLEFGEDGTVLYTQHIGLADGHIAQSKLNLETGNLAEEPKHLWSGTGGVWPEGPHLYHRGDWWYLIISEGGTSYEHSVTVARSHSPWGPFEPCPDNPVLTHIDIPNHPLQAIGHCDLVETPSGWWALCLGVRPIAGRFHHIGRETLLLPVTWSKEGWPQIGVDGRVELTMTAPDLPEHRWDPLPIRDDFEKKTLDFHWNFIRNPNYSDWSLTEQSGALRLHGSGITLSDQDSPAFVGRRQTGMNIHAATSVQFDPKHENEEAGLVVRQIDRFYYQAVVTIRNGKRVVLLRKVLNGIQEQVGPLIPVADGPVEINLETTPTTYVFSCLDSAGKSSKLGSLSAQDLSIERVNSATGAFHFTGVWIGMHATGNGKSCTTPADFDWFDYEVKQK